MVQPEDNASVGPTQLREQEAVAEPAVDGKALPQPVIKVKIAAELMNIAD